MTPAHLSLIVSSSFLFLSKASFRFCFHLSDSTLYLSVISANCFEFSLWTADNCKKTLKLNTKNIHNQYNHEMRWQKQKQKCCIIISGFSATREHHLKISKHNRELCQYNRFLFLHGYINILYEPNMLGPLNLT